MIGRLWRWLMEPRLWRSRLERERFPVLDCSKGLHPSFRFLGSPAFAKQCIVCAVVIYFDNMPDGVYGFVEALRTAKHNPVDATIRFAQTLQRCTHYCFDCERGVPVESLTARSLDGSLVGCPYCGSNQMGDRRSHEV